MSDIYQALARTALLIELDIFGPGAGHHAIIDGLRDTTARIITDRANIDTPAGQTALVTLYALLAMQGLRIDPDVPAEASCAWVASATWNALRAMGSRITNIHALTSAPAIVA